MLDPEFFAQGHFIPLLIAAGLGALIGLERELSGKDPSLRTFSLICLGSCVFALISKDVALSSHMGDPGRIAAQVVTGIGFLGAGSIFRARERVLGLTTAALMWTTAAIGLAAGFDRVELAISATIIALCITALLKFVHRLVDPIKGERPSIPNSQE